jgi:cytochrome c oxidase assembly protein subunit 15
MSQTKFRRIALAAWVMQALIVLSGAAVRLTQAGLGCEDWPTCNDDELLPEWEVHGLIEFGNRVISGFVAVSAVLAVVAAYRRLPRRPDLIRLAWGLVAGTAAQVVLGGITVLADLHPIVVSVHFLVSMILLWNAQTLWVRSGQEHHTVRTAGEWPARLQLALAAAVLLTGTIVTGTGPNSGDSRADRLNFELESVARIHSACVWLLIATVVVMAVRIVRSGGQGSAAFVAARWLLLAIVAQGTLGYTQFALGVPPALVEAHVFGAIVVWSLAINFFIRLNSTRSGTPERTLAAVD